MAFAKKAELSTELMIGLIIAIVLIVIVIFMIAKKADFFQRNIDCGSQGGRCVNAADCSAGRIYNADCEKKQGQPAQVCCIAKPAK